MSKKCFFGCVIDGKLHSFPRPISYKYEGWQQEKFNKWKSILDENTIKKGDEYIRTNVALCYRHFEFYLLASGRLSKNAVPTLNIGQRTTHQPSHNMLGTSSHPDTSNLGLTPGPLAPKQCIVPLTTSVDPVAITLGGEDPIINEHNYSLQHRLRRKPVYKIGLIYEKNIKKLRSEICRLRKRGKMFKQQLQSAKKLSNIVAFKKITKNMTKTAQLFAHMQLQTKKNVKGIRFSLEEKKLSLSLYKKSPKCYRLLCKYFTLPSSRTMVRLLRQIKITSGINPIIFERLKKTLLEKKRLIDCVVSCLTKCL